MESMLQDINKLEPAQPALLTRNAPGATVQIVGGAGPGAAL